MCKYAQSTSPLYLSFLDRAIHMAAHEEAGLPSPSGEAHEHFGGAEPCGTSPPVQTDQFSEGELEEVGQEGRLCVPSLPATPVRELASVGLPCGTPQSPSRAHSAASGADSSPGRAQLAGDCSEDSVPTGEDALYAPPGFSLAASLNAMVAREVSVLPYEGGGGSAERALATVGFAADPGVGPSASSLSCVRSLGEVDPSTTLPPPVGGEYGGTDLERISDGGVVSLSEADPPRSPSPTESEAADEWREQCAHPGARTQAPPMPVGHHWGLDPPGSQPHPSVAPASPSSSGEEEALEEWRRACAQAAQGK